MVPETLNPELENELNAPQEEGEDAVTHGRLLEPEHVQAIERRFSAAASLRRLQVRALVYRDNLKAAEEVIEAHPEDPGLANSLGRFLLSIGRYSDLKHLAHRLGHMPVSPEALKRHYRDVVRRADVYGIVSTWELAGKPPNNLEYADRQDLYERVIIKTKRNSREKLHELDQVLGTDRPLIKWEHVQSHFERRLRRSLRDVGDPDRYQAKNLLEDMYDFFDARDRSQYIQPYGKKVGPVLHPPLAREVVYGLLDLAAQKTIHPAEGLWAVEKYVLEVGIDPQSLPREKVSQAFVALLQRSGGGDPKSYQRYQGWGDRDAHHIFEFSQLTGVPLPTEAGLYRGLARGLVWSKNRDTLELLCQKAGLGLETAVNEALTVFFTDPEVSIVEWRTTAREYLQTYRDVLGAHTVTELYGRVLAETDHRGWGTVLEEFGAVVKPSEVIAQLAYDTVLRVAADEGDLYFIPALTERFGFLPDFRPATIQTTYQRFLTSKQAAALGALRSITGVEVEGSPEQLERQFQIQVWYEQIITALTESIGSVDFWNRAQPILEQLGEIMAMHAVTGVELPPSVTNAIRAIFEEHQRKFTETNDDRIVPLMKQLVEANVATLDDPRSREVIVKVLESWLRGLSQDSYSGSLRTDIDFPKRQTLHRAAVTLRGYLEHTEPSETTARIFQELIAKDGRGVVALCQALNHQLALSGDQLESIARVYLAELAETYYDTKETLPKRLEDLRRWLTVPNSEPGQFEQHLLNAVRDRICDGQWLQGDTAVIDEIVECAQRAGLTTDPAAYRLSFIQEIQRTMLESGKYLRVFQIYRFTGVLAPGLSAEHLEEIGRHLHSRGNEEFRESARAYQRILQETGLLPVQESLNTLFMKRIQDVNIKIDDQVITLWAELSEQPVEELLDGAIEQLRQRRQWRQLIEFCDTFDRKVLKLSHEELAEVGAALSERSARGLVASLRTIKFQDLDQDEALGTVFARVLPVYFQEDRPEPRGIQSIPGSVRFLPESQRHFIEAMTRQPAVALQKRDALQKWAESYPALPALPWESVFRQLQQVQAPAARAEHDPWRTDLEPLLASAFQQRLLDPTSVADGELLVDFVREVGMYKTPLLLTTYLAARRARQSDELSPEVRQHLTEFGINPDRVQPNQIPHELRARREALLTDLLADRVPEVLKTSKLAQELFDSIRGSTKWEQGDQLKDLVAAWETTLRDNPGTDAMPEAYQPVTLTVAGAEAATESVEEQTTMERQVILENPELLKLVQMYAESYRESQSGSSAAEWWTQVQSKFLTEVQERIETLAKKRADLVDEKAIKGLEAQLGNLRAVAERMQTVTPSFPDRDEELSTLASLLTQIQPIMKGKIPGSDMLLRAISGRYILQALQRAFPAQHEALQQLISNQHEELTEQAVNAWRDHLVDVLDEHFLTKGAHREETSELPTELLKSLRAAWGISKKRNEHFIVASAERLQALHKGEFSGSVKVQLVPVKGILRVFAGDVGDACYTKLHRSLASGEYPGLTAYIMTTGTSARDFRLRGSVLAIEANSEAGPVLLVRANNPTESLLGSVDGEQLTAQILDAMIELAKRRGLSHVLVPLDRATASCSNRKLVAEYYDARYKDAQKLDLEQTPETSFNTYANWNSKGPHGCVVIWSRPGATLTPREVTEAS